MNSAFWEKYKIIIIQSVTLFLFALLNYLLRSTLEIKSFLLGGVAWIIPSVYFSMARHRIRLKIDNGSMLRYFFSHEIIKWLLNLLVIISILLVFRISPPSFLGGYVITILVSLIVSLVEMKK